MNLNESYWDDRYKNNNTGWDLGMVSPPLKSYFDQLEDKELRILIPGGGNSYEAEYLFSKGFPNIYVVDLSRTVLERFQERVPAFPSEHLLHNNFFDLDMKFDLIIEQTFFCALDPKLRPEYVSKMHQLLSDQGKLVGLLFSVPLNTDHPPFGGSKAEYLALFKNKFEIRSLDTAYNSVEPRQSRELFFRFLKK